jgi:flagellar hook-basal body complex protein FliE
VSLFERAGGVEAILVGDAKEELCFFLRPIQLHFKPAQLTCPLISKQGQIPITSGYPLVGIKNTLYNAINSINKETLMSTVVANDLKTKGIKAIEDALLTQPEASLSVRGQIKYVVMSQDHYHYLRECELEAALAESKANLASGNFVKETVTEHLKRLKQLNKAAK